MEVSKMSRSLTKCAHTTKRSNIRLKFALKLLFVIELVEFFFIDIIRSELNKMAYTIELDALYAYQYAKSIGLCKEVKIAEISFPGLDFGGKNRFDWRAIKKMPSTNWSENVEYLQISSFHVNFQATELLKLVFGKNISVIWVWHGVGIFLSLECMHSETNWHFECFVGRKYAIQTHALIVGKHVECNRI